MCRCTAMSTSSDQEKSNECASCLGAGCAANTTDQTNGAATPLSKGATTSFSGSDSVSSDLEDDQPSTTTFAQKLWKFYCKNEFMILMICVILLAKAYPPLGAVYLAPKITASWLAVCIIFLLAGLGLKTEEFANAFKQIWFNVYVQAFNFGAVSAFVYVVALGLQASNILSKELIDGIVICSCLPMTVNMVMVLTYNSGGDEPLATINSAVGNLLGIFLSPMLILGYLGVSGDINIGTVVWKMVLRVVFPVIVGQVIQKAMPAAFAFYQKWKKPFKSFGEYSLVYIVYCVFCQTFSKEQSSSSLGDIFIMIPFLFLILICIMIAAWITLGFLFHDYPEMRVMGLYGCTHKTIAMGIPLIGAIYENSPNVGVYTLPLLIWYPMQLFVGTFLVPRLVKWVEQERIRLDKNTSDEENIEKSSEQQPEVKVDAEEVKDIENGAATVAPLSSLQGMDDVSLEPKDEPQGSNTV